MTRLREAITVAIAELGEVHRPEWASAEAQAAGKDPLWCATCGASDGDWPCTTSLIVDDLRAALAGEPHG